LKETTPKTKKQRPLPKKNARKQKRRNWNTSPPPKHVAAA